MFEVVLSIVVSQVYWTKMYIHLNKHSKQQSLNYTKCMNTLSIEKFINWVVHLPRCSIKHHTWRTYDYFESYKQCFYSYDLISLNLVTLNYITELP